MLLQYLVLYLRVGATLDGGRTGYLYALGFGLLGFFRSLGQTQSQMICLRTGIRVRLEILSIYGMFDVLCVAALG